MLKVLLSIILGVIGTFSRYIRPARLHSLDGIILHCNEQLNQNFISHPSIQTFTTYSVYLNAIKPKIMMVYLFMTISVEELNEYFIQFCH